MSLVGEVRQLLNETAGPVFWTDLKIYDACNEALMWVWGENKWQLTTSTMTFTASADLVALPSTLFIPQQIFGTDGQYFETTLNLVEEWDRGWKSATPAYPREFIPWDVQTVRAYPKPDQTYTFRVGGVGYPSEIGAGNEDLIADHAAFHAVVFKAASLLLEYTRPELAEELDGYAQEHIYEHRKQLRNKLHYQFRKLRPATAFGNAQAGAIRPGKQFT